jgi:hypothetical protein
MTNLRIMPVDDFAAAYVIAGVAECQIRIVQILELRIGCA